MKVRGINCDYTLLMPQGLYRVQNCSTVCRIGTGNEPGSYGNGECQDYRGQGNFRLDAGVPHLDFAHGHRRTYPYKQSD